MATTTLTSNLKLRISSDLTSDSKYNLLRLDSLGSVMQTTISEVAVLRSQTSINIQPNDPDIGGSGTGGIINFGTTDQPAGIINLNATTLNIEANIESDGDLKTSGCLVLSANSFDINVCAPASLAAGYTLTLPVDDGLTNQVLTTNGSGVLSWSTVAGSGSGGQELAAPWVATDGMNITITHSFGTRQVMVQVLDAADNYKTIEVDSICRSTDNTVEIEASITPVSWVVLLKEIV